jgi:hypothetical protein
MKVEHLDRGLHLLRSAGCNLIAVDEYATTAGDVQREESEE